jgi:hypothetical protein
VLRYDRPAELRRGIEDNLRSLAVDRLTVVNLRLMDGAPPGQYFDDQLAAMVAAREDGLIGGIGLSNITSCRRPGPRGEAVVQRRREGLPGMQAGGRLAAQGRASPACPYPGRSRWSG